MATCQSAQSCQKSPCPPRSTHMQRVLPLQRSVQAALASRVIRIRIVVPPRMGLFIRILGRISRVKVITLLAMLQTLVPSRSSSPNRSASLSVRVVSMRRVERPLAGMVGVGLLRVGLLLRVRIVAARVGIRSSVLRVLSHRVIDRRRVRLARSRS